LFVSCCVLTLFIPVQAVVNSVDNGVAHDPIVQCLTDRLLVRFDTKREFEGHVYVKGHYEDKSCRSDATLSSNVSISVPFTSTCDVRRQRSSNPRGLYVSVVLIISFHPMFVTRVDRSYNVQCFYTEADHTVTTQLDVSLGIDQQKKIVVMIGSDGKPIADTSGQLRNGSSSFGDIDQLPTQVITQNIPLPTCKYQVLDDGPKGKPVKYAIVGQQVYHQWSCHEDPKHDNNVFCATIHSCNVRDEGGKEVQLLDENGCAVDKYLLNNLEYTSPLQGGQTSQVFKFADQPSLFFQCQIRLSLKEAGVCKRSSDTCPSAVRGKRAVVEGGGEQSDVDVFSQSMTIFDIDDPISAKTVRELDTEPEPIGWKASVCVSPAIFGGLLALLVAVFVISGTAVALLCLRPAKKGKLHLVH